MDVLSDLTKAGVSAFSTSGSGSASFADLALAEPSAPAEGNVRTFGRRVGGRAMLAYMGPSGLSTAVQSLLSRNKFAWANAVGGSTTMSTVGIALSATGNGTSASMSASNVQTAMQRLEYAVTTAATSAVAGWRSSVNAYHIGSPSTPYGGFHFVCRFGRGRGAAANATLRGFTGLSSITTAPSDSNPSTALTNAIGVGCDDSDTNYQIIHRSGTSAATKVDTGIPKAVADNSEMYEIALFAAPTESVISYTFTRLSDGLSFSGEISTNKPADTTMLSPRGYFSVGGTSSVIGYMLSGFGIESDY